MAKFNESQKQCDQIGDLLVFWQLSKAFVDH